MNLDKNLIKICKKKKMTLASLAKRSGVKQPTLHGWTTGRSVQNLDDLRKVCEVLEVSLHSLLFDKEDPFENKDQILQELFKGDVRITIHKIDS
jgi:transcriptional regulator with XRE-family HTH domain